MLRPPRSPSTSGEGTPGSGPGAGPPCSWPRTDFAGPYEALARARGGLPPSLGGFLAAAEAWLIVRALAEAGGNRSAAARRLGIGRRTLYTKLARIGAAPRPGRRRSRTRRA